MMVNQNFKPYLMVKMPHDEHFPVKFYHWSGPNIVELHNTSSPFMRCPPLLFLKYVPFVQTTLIDTPRHVEQISTAGAYICITLSM